MERLNEGIRQSRSTHEDCLRQQRQREEELQDLIRTMDEREVEYQETRKVQFASHYGNMACAINSHFLSCGYDNFQLKILDIFVSLAQNIDHGYRLEPSQ